MPLRQRNGNDVEEFVPKEDWAKIIHIQNDKFLVCGGSAKVGNESVYSQAAMIVELDNGIVREVEPMHSKRQAHGICNLANYVYVCGGLSGLYLLNRCERFDIISEKWYSDLPLLNEYKFSMTICPVDNKWLYSFGGATAYYDENQRELVIERLDTYSLRRHDEPDAQLYNREQCAWEILRIRSRF